MPKTPLQMKNAVIVSDNGNLIVCHPVCPKCGRIIRSQIINVSYGGAVMNNQTIIAGTGNVVRAGSGCNIQVGSSYNNGNVNTSQNGGSVFCIGPRSNVHLGSVSCGSGCPPFSVIVRS